MRRGHMARLRNITRVFIKMDVGMFAAGATKRAEINRSDAVNRSASFFKITLNNFLDTLIQKIFF